MAVIERAEQRLQEEIRQNDLGSDNGHLLAYWAAYLDGARAQKKESAKDPYGPMREIMVDQQIDLKLMSKKLFLAETKLKQTGVYASDGMEILLGDKVRGLFLYGLPITGTVIFKDGSFGVEWYRGEVKEFTPFTSTCNVTWEIVKEVEV